MQNLFPSRYGKPVLIDVLAAADMGWSGECDFGNSPQTGSTACGVGSGPQSTCTFGVGKGTPFDQGSGSERLINPGDVSQGL